LTGLDLLSFSGVNEKNINYLRNKFTVSGIVLRGENIFIKSEDIKEFPLLQRTIEELIFLSKRQGEIRTEDIDLVLSLLDSGSGNNAKDLTVSKDSNNIILFNKNDYIKPRTPTQIEYYRQISENDIVFAIGPAGTGKTYLAVAFAVAALKNKQVNKIVLARPAVEAGESLGFLPGDLSEKIDPYLKPLFDALEDMLPYEKLKSHLEKNIIEIVPLAYMRGRTLSNSFVILDEAQNASTMQMKMFLTRLGPNSKAIITGDVTQTDLPKKELSGLIQVEKILKKIDGVSFVYFNKNDVVRHKLVKDIIDAYDNFDKNTE
jgi:phosphate starvation-inducible protein PhoH and related proteins